MSVTYGSGKCKFPCSTCFVKQENVASYPTSINKPGFRTEASMKKILSEIADGKSTEETHSVYQFDVSVCISFLCVNVYICDIFVCCSARCGDSDTPNLHLGTFIDV